MNKCLTCGENIWYFSPNKQYCCVACEQNASKNPPSIEDLFWNLFKKWKY